MRKQSIQLSPLLGPVSLQLNLPMKAFSVNQVSTRDVRFKTGAYKAWASEFLYRISEYDFSELQQAYEKHRGVLSVHIVAIYPEQIYYNSFGKISSKTFDVSNIEKPILDLLFNTSLGIDDRNVEWMTSRKCSGSDFALDIRIQFVPPDQDCL